MKNLLFVSLILLALSSSAQKIGGFYSGTLYNDSTKMVQKYELALSEYRGKISGYSYVTFIAHDTFYYGIRKIKANIEGDSLIVQDDKMIVNNFPEAPAKGVGRTITIPLKGQDSVVMLNGRWKTNQTKKYYSVPGAIDLTRTEDSTHSPLIAHLKELNIIPSVPYQQTDMLAQTKTIVKEDPVKETAYKETKVKETKDKEKKDKSREVATVAVNVTDVKTAEVNPKEQKTKIKTETKTKQAADAKQTAVATAPTTLSYDQRRIKVLDAVDVSSDSLVLAFYDNGVVDGDSISVYLNGQNIISRARLLSVATKKTISVAGLDKVELLLVAENLGSIPPNTGLLTIRDGENLYQVNFSADMQTNASIVLRRKKKN
ncbi:MAG: hypothetical protein ACJ75B_15590 [Flavisolibacter sp.]